MRTLVLYLFFLLLSLGAGGCGSDRERGLYRGKDRPVPPSDKAPLRSTP
jgi:hypothetical protein